MGLRSFHCLPSISMVTHKMASSSHWVWIGYQFDKTSPWIRDKNHRYFLWASDNRASYRRCGLSFQHRSSWSRVSGQNLAYMLHRTVIWSNQLIKLMGKKVIDQNRVRLNEAAAPTSMRSN